MVSDVKGKEIAVSSSPTLPSAPFLPTYVIIDALCFFSNLFLSVVLEQLTRMWAGERTMGIFIEHLFGPSSYIRGRNMEW